MRVRVEASETTSGLGNWLAGRLAHCVKAVWMLIEEQDVLLGRLTPVHL